MNLPLWAAYSGLALVVLMAGVLAGYMIARAVTEREQYDAEIAAYERQIQERHRPRHARAPLPPELERAELEAPELEAPKSSAPPLRAGQLHGTWPRPARLIIVAGSQRSRFPLEDTGTMDALAGELEVITTANIEAMRADNAAWLEAWAGAAP